MAEQPVGEIDLPIAGTLPRLRADWRGEYVSSAADAERVDKSNGLRVEDAERCVFCRILAGTAHSAALDDSALDDSAYDPVADEARLIVHRGQHCLVILNAYPYTSGHCMVMPVRHVATLVELHPEEAAELWDFVTHATAALGVAYSPEGINIGANLGRSAGAGVPGHLHVHLVPRWNGDTNFMTTIAETRVVPESLPSTWRKLHDAW